MAAQKVAIHWFRKGLRLHDNPALLRACEGAAFVIPVFVLDPWFLSPERVGGNRVRFLLESLQNLDDSLRGLGSRLVVLRGPPLEVLPAAAGAWAAAQLTFEVDTEPYAIERDAGMREVMSTRGVATEACSSHTLYNMQDILDVCGGEVPTSFQGFRRAIMPLGPYPAPVPAPAALPALPDGAIEAVATTDGFFDGIPSLQQLGYPAPTQGPPLFRGGEHAGLELARANLARRDWVCAFRKPDTSPTAVQAPSTTGLSAHFKFGTVSARWFMAELQSVLRAARAAGRSPSLPPVSLEGQLLWREFYYANAFCWPNYDRMVGNPVCRQVAWDSDPELLGAWEAGRTGYPWIDACMRQLHATGWLHHLGRHAVACFLTRGDLYQSWEAGAKAFDRLLIDSDWALNTGNWLWLSASAHFHQYWKVYSPVAFAKKTDPKGDYVRRWVPELRRYPAKFIYEPWRAPPLAQQAWGCVVGKDYPAPIVDHAMASARCKQRHKEAFAAAKAGRPPSPAVGAGSKRQARPAASGSAAGVQVGRGPVEGGAAAD